MSVSFDLAGKVAVVTGGSRGIGLAIGAALVAHGATVASWSRDLTTNRAAAAGISAHAFRCDVSDRGDVERAMAETVDQLGRVDILVANAGVAGEDTPFPQTDPADWDQVIATNLTAAFTTVRHFSLHAIDRGGGGKVVLVSSVVAEVGLPRAIAYASAKAGLLGFTRSAATALARHDIQVNCVEPGWTETDMVTDQLGDDRVGRALIRRTPARRFGTVDDIAGVVVYLVSSAADFHTGDVVRVDGGFVLGW